MAPITGSSLPLLRLGFPPSSKMALGTEVHAHDGGTIPTPWPTLNRLFGGNERGDGGGLWPGLHVVTGPTGAGKTQFAVQLAHHAASEGMPVIYVALDPEAEDVLFRIYGLILAKRGVQSRPSWSQLKRGQAMGELSRAERFAEADPNLLDRMRVEEAGAFSWEAGLLRDRAEAFRQHLGPGSDAWPMLIVVDYLQLVGSPTRPHGAREPDIRERIGKAAYAAREVGRDPKINAAVVLLSSVARAAANTMRDESDNDRLGNGDAARFVGSGKESNEIEYFADSVMVLMPGQQPPHDKDASQRPVHLALAKNRIGPTGWVKLQFERGSVFHDQEANLEVLR